MKASRNLASGRCTAAAWLTMLLCLVLYHATAFGQWRVTGHEPKEPPYASVNESNERGETRETRYVREKDGRVSRMVQTTKDKKGRTLSITNEWYDDHGNLIGGARQQFGYDPPYRRDMHYVPPKGKEKGGWEDIPVVTASVTGLVTPELATSYGNVKVNLPDDLAAGDTISGTVAVAPAGQNRKEIAKNQDELNGCVVELEDQKTKTGQKWGKWVIPATATAVALVVFDHRGREIARDAVPVGADGVSSLDETRTPIETGGPVSPDLTPAKPSDYHLPRMGQVGKPAIIRGPFGGDSMATSVKIGGQDVPILAESPRQVVAQNPSDVFGPTQIEVKENNVVARGAYRNVSVSLAADKTVLRDGEQTTVTLTLRGFQRIEKPLRVRLSNHSPEIVTMEGGNVQEIEVLPEMVSSEGVYTKTIPLMGLHPGSFALGVALADTLWDTVDNTGGNPINEIGDELPLPVTETERKKLIQDWYKAWEAKKIENGSKKAAEDAQKSADDAKKAAEDAKKIVDAEPNAPDIDKLKEAAAEKKSAAETKQKEADAAKGAAEAAKATSDAANDTLDKSKVPTGERVDLYKKEASKLEEEAKAAQTAADRAKKKMEEGVDEDKWKKYGDEKQKEADTKKQQATDLRKAASDSTNSGNR